MMDMRARSYGVMGQSCHLCAAAPIDAVDLEGAVVCLACLRRLDANPQLKRRILFRSFAFSA